MTLTYPVDIFGQRTGAFAQWPSQNWTGWNVYWMNAAGQHVSMGGTDSWLAHEDAIGTTTQVTDETGAVVFDSEYYPWGQVWQRGGPRPWSVFAGLHFPVNDPLDPATFREYNPRLGRWMTPDPLGGDVTDPQSLNRYAYVLNNPASLDDPLGLKTCGGNGPTIPNGVNALSWCKTHIWLVGGSSPSAFFSNNADEFDLLGMTYIDNGEGGLMPALITNGAEVVNLLSNGGIFSGGSVFDTPATLGSAPAPPAPPTISVTIHGQYSAWKVCVANSVGSRISGDFGQAVAKQGLKGEAPNANTDLATSILEGSAETQAECLNKNPLAPLDPEYRGPHPGYVFEPVPFPANLVPVLYRSVW